MATRRAAAGNQPLFRALPVSGEYAFRSSSIEVPRDVVRYPTTRSTFRSPGTPARIVQGDYADGLQGGPDYWAVQTDGGMLNLHDSASTGAPVVDHALPMAHPCATLAAAWPKGADGAVSPPCPIPVSKAGWRVISWSKAAAKARHAASRHDPRSGRATDAWFPAPPITPPDTVDCVRNADAAAAKLRFWR